LLPARIKMIFHVQLPMPPDKLCRSFLWLNRIELKPQADHGKLNEKKILKNVECDELLITSPRGRKGHHFPFGGRIGFETSGRTVSQINLCSTANLISVAVFFTFSLASKFLR
jgi:hypothetical protein